MFNSTEHKTIRRNNPDINETLATTASFVVSEEFSRSYKIKIQINGGSFIAPNCNVNLEKSTIKGSDVTLGCSIKYEQETIKLARSVFVTCFANQDSYDFLRTHGMLRHTSEDFMLVQDTNEGVKLSYEDINQYGEYSYAYGERYKQYLQIAYQGRVKPVLSFEQVRAYTRRFFNENRLLSDKACFEKIKYSTVPLLFFEKGAGKLRFSSHIPLTMLHVENFVIE